MTQLMSINPDPAQNGQDVTVCYSGTPKPSTITVKVDPGGETTNLPLDEDGCATFSVPDEASLLTFSDPTGASPNLTAVPV